MFLGFINLKKMVCSDFFISSCLLIIICFLYPTLVKSNSGAVNCKYDQTEINKRIYSLLYENKESPYVALDYLKTKIDCVTTKEEQALYKDSIAGIWIDIYKKDKTKSSANKATKLLLEAIKLDTKYSNEIKLSLAYLLYHKEDYERATGLVNSILSSKPEKPGPYLALGLDIEVARERWKEARELVDIVFRYDATRFLYSHHFLSAVQTLCHFNEYDNAQKFLDYYEDKQPDVFKIENSQKRLAKAKHLINSDCRN